MRYLAATVLVVVLLVVLLLTVPSTAFYFMTAPDYVLAFLEDAGFYDLLEDEVVSLLELEGEAADILVEEAAIASQLQLLMERNLPPILHRLRGWGQHPPLTLDLTGLGDHLEGVLSREEVYLELLRAQEPDVYQMLADLPQEERSAHVEEAVDEILGETSFPEHIHLEEFVGGEGLRLESRVRLAFRLFVASFYVLLAMVALIAILVFLLAGRAGFWFLAAPLLAAGGILGLGNWLLNHFVFEHMLAELIPGEPLWLVAEVPLRVGELVLDIAGLYLGLGLGLLAAGLLWLLVRRAVPEGA